MDALIPPRLLLGVTPEGGPREVLLSAEGRRVTLICSVGSAIGGWKVDISTDVFLTVLTTDERGDEVISRGMRVASVSTEMAVLAADGREKKEGRPSRPFRRLGDVESFDMVRVLKRGAIVMGSDYR